MFYNTNVTHSSYSFYRELVTFARNYIEWIDYIREEKLSDDYSGRNECAREECLMYSLQHVMLDGSKSTGLRPSPARF